MKSKKMTAVILGAVLVAVLAIGGMYLASNNSESKTVSTDANQQQSPPPAASTTPKADYEGKILTSSGDKFSIVVPNGWKTFVSCTNSDLFFVGDFSAASLEYKEAETPVIEERVCGDDSRKLFFAAANKASIAEPADPEASAFVTNAGLEGTRICKENVQSGGISDDVLLQDCEYRFEKDSVVYSLTYTRPDSSYLDRTALVDRVIKSFVIQ